MIWTLLFTIIREVYGFIGYDCGSLHLNVTTLSLLEIGNCDLPESKINITRRYVQLLQINQYTETRIMQCKMEIHRTIYYCGMNSHISIVSNGENKYINDISRSACQDVQETGILKVSESHIVYGIKVNQTVTHSIILAGYSNGEGKCNGAGYSGPFGTWENVVVQGTIKITLTEQQARINLNTNTIHFNNDQIIYSLVTQDITFALVAKGRESVCGYTLVKTENPKLVIFETVRGDSFATNKENSVSNLDIFVYVNSKFVYVEKHIRSQMKQLYNDVIAQKCNLEKQTLKNSSSIATQAPDEFAFDLIEGPGYMGVVAGEVVHIVKCVPVEIK